MLFTNTNGDWPSFETDADRNSKTDASTARLVEHARTGQSVLVERDSRLVRNVAIAGAVSRNGYRYESDALKRAVPLYVGRPVFLDHSPNPEQPQSRSTRDLVGTLESVRFEAGDGGDSGGLIRGDIRVLDTESGRTFLALCESDEPGVGMSHVVMARRSEDGSVVESIEKVVSVDAVMFPATTSRLSEQDESADTSCEASDGCSECESDGVDGRWRKRCGELEAERGRLQEENERLLTEVRVVRREKMLAESGLPTSAVSVVFRDAVMEAVDEDAAGRLIADRVILVRESRVSRPMSDPLIDTAVRADGFADVIRRRR